MVVQRRDGSRRLREHDDDDDDDGREWPVDDSLKQRSQWQDNKTGPSH